MRKNPWIIDVSLVILIVLLSVFFYNKLRELEDIQADDTSSVVQETKTPTEEPEPTETIISNDSKQMGTSAPDFNLKDLNGEIVTLSDYFGTPIMINFWATWCTPCVSEMALIDEYTTLYEGELIVLEINAGELEAEVREYLDQYDLHMVFLLDPSSSLASKYYVAGYPTSVFIDEDGFIQVKYAGELDESELTSYLEEIGVGE